MLTFSIVTPSFNQAEFISETIESVFAQKGDFNINYIVVDGGSTDGTVEILKTYEEKLKNKEIRVNCNNLNYSWISERDNGQYDAINKGFKLVEGNIMAWINSDDKYTPWAFSVVHEIFKKFGNIEWISSTLPMLWNSSGQAILVNDYDGFNKKAFFKGYNLCGNKWYAKQWISQDNTFWKRSLWVRSKAILDSHYDLAADFKLWCHFYKFTNLHGVKSPLAGYRFHEIQKTNQPGKYREEAEEILFNNGGKPYGKLETFFRKKIFPGMMTFNVLRKILKTLKISYPTYHFECLNRNGQWNLIKKDIV